MPGTIGETTAEKRQGAVWEEDSALQDAISNANEQVIRLERKLSPILKSVPPQAQSEKPEKPHLPELLDRLHARCEAVRAIENQLGSLVERLEI